MVYSLADAEVLQRVHAHRYIIQRMVHEVNLHMPQLCHATPRHAMPCCAVLICAALCCAVLRCAALCCAVLRCAVLCCAVL